MSRAREEGLELRFEPIPLSDRADPQRDIPRITRQTFLFRNNKFPFLIQTPKYSHNKQLYKTTVMLVCIKTFHEYITEDK